MRKIDTRRVDELGRFVIPREVRTAMGIDETSRLDIYLSENEMVLRLNTETPACTICGDTESDLLQIKNKVICSCCISQIKSL